MQQPQRNEVLRCYRTERHQSAYVHGTSE